MSILIHDMEMPKNCIECHARCRLYLNGRKFRHPDCPLIELPPHGRLIDADELLNKTICNPLWSPYITKKMVLDAKTIIEAEGSEE